MRKFRNDQTPKGVLKLCDAVKGQVLDLGGARRSSIVATGVQDFLPNVWPCLAHAELDSPNGV